MKTLLKATMLAVLLTACLSCKKDHNTNTDPYAGVSDSTEAAIDTIGPHSDSINTGATGTTGAVGEGSTGSGTAGSVQKGAENVKTDSVSAEEDK